MLAPVEQIGRGERFVDVTAAANVRAAAVGNNSPKSHCDFPGFAMLRSSYSPAAPEATHFTIQAPGSRLSGVGVPVSHHSWLSLPRCNDLTLSRCNPSALSLCPLRPFVARFRLLICVHRCSSVVKPPFHFLIGIYSCAFVVDLLRLCVHVGKSVPNNSSRIFAIRSPSSSFSSAAMLCIFT
jgi:hypothetical protein